MIDKAAKCRALLAILPLVLLPRLAGAERPARKSSAEVRRVEGVPPRPHDAISGSEFARRTAGLPSPDRQQAVLAELRSGNFPDFLRTLKPVRLSHESAGGETHTATIWAMPDYLAIGSDKDFLRIPLTRPSALAIAGEFGCVLPTCRMVDAIYEQSEVQLEPQPLPAGPEMRTMAYYVEHQRRVEAQRAGRPLGELIAGQKKDVVLTNRLFTRPDRIAIYGWHRLNGEPIQPLSTVHGEHYEDYSHGIRLVSSTVWIDGKHRSIFEVLQDPSLAPVLTYEGRTANLQALIPAPTRESRLTSLPDDR